MAESEVTTPQAGEATTQAVTPAQTQAVNPSEPQAGEETISLEEAKKLRKEAQTLRNRIAKFEEAETARKDAELSETEKLKKQLAEKEAALKLRDHQDLQRQAAEEVGLPPIFAKRLEGETLEELKADAAIILEALPKKQAANAGATNPGSNATGQSETDAQRLARIHGRSVNIWDPNIIASLGGGVISVDKE